MAIARRLKRGLVALCAVLGILLWFVALLLFTRVTENTDDFARLQNWILAINSIGIRLLARNACAGSGKNSGRARLWYNDTSADSGFDAMVFGQHLDFFLRDYALLGNSPGDGPKRTADVLAGAKCSPYESFGVWSRILLP